MIAPLRLLLCYTLLTVMSSFDAYCTAKDSPIVLIFDKIPEYVRSTFPFPKMEYTDGRNQLTIFDNFREFGFNPRSEVSDTIVFNSQNQQIVVSFLYIKHREPLSYLFQKGDTITFKFINGLPYANSNSKSKDEVINYEYDRLISNRYAEDVTAYDIYQYPIIVAKDLNDFMSNLGSVPKEYYKPARAYLELELSALNSSVELRREYPEIFSFIEDKLRYQITKLDFDQKKVSKDSLDTILALNKQTPVDGLSYSYFYPLLNAISDSVNVRTAKLMKYENGTETDYRDVYDRVIKWEAINDVQKRYLLFQYLQRIGEIFSTSDLQKYLAKFTEFSNDSILSARIQNDFLLPTDPTLLAGDSLYVIDGKNNSLSFQNLIKKNKGKLIYIDFWASWCMPCRAEMKGAAQLRNDFSNKEVVFVYLSIDKTKRNWETAVTAEGLNAVKNNYIVTNSESSSFLRSIDFRAIPRYLLYDKNGNLVHQKAPSPGSEEVRQLLMEYLLK